MRRRVRPRLKALLMTQTDNSSQIVIIGGGFTGLSAAYEIAKRGRKAVILEQDSEVGGLAGSFEVAGQALERFYHHWFTNDVHIMKLIRDIGREKDIVYRPTRTGLYYANKIYRLSNPLDLLKFSALGFLDRLRLGLLVLRARSVKDWRAIEHLTARDWLIDLAGHEVFRMVWEPLLVGKFGSFAGQVGAVWFWKKLILRGGSRARGGKEILAYFRGGFGALAQALRDEIIRFGGEVRTNQRAIGLKVDHGQCTGVETTRGVLPAKAVLMTCALPELADFLAPHVPQEYRTRLLQIKYLANLCLVLELKHSLSETYWLNVNDPSFPFVGIIEHTNFESADSYGGRHIVYLSKYLPENEALYRMDDEAVLEFATPHIQKMFPDFRREWIIRHHVWRARFAQPIAVPGYSSFIPSQQTPIPNIFITTMAQIYPEDRGTNYAVREGRKIGRWLVEERPS